MKDGSPKCEFLNLDVSANTDFAQVEADDQQINLTRFSLFFPEKRQFLWERNANVGVGYNATLIRSGEHFDPALGFKIREDFTSLGSRVSYGWIPSESSSFQVQRFTLDNTAVLRNTDGKAESAELGLTWNGDTKAGAFYIAGGRVNYESLPTAFSVSSKAQVPAGEYTFYSVNASYRLWGKLLRGSVSASAGSFYDGSKFSFEVAPGWSVSRHFQWSGFYQFNRVRFPERGQNFDGHVLRLRATTSFNTSLSINSFVQWNSAANLVTLNLRLRYNFSEGNDFYLVYNEALNTSRDRVSPALPLTSSGAIMAKYTYTFGF